jgi:hypothetical protein
MKKKLIVILIVALIFINEYNRYLIHGLSTLDTYEKPVTPSKAYECTCSEYPEADHTISDESDISYIIIWSNTSLHFRFSLPKSGIFLFAIRFWNSQIRINESELISKNEEEYYFYSFNINRTDIVIEVYACNNTYVSEIFGYYMNSDDDIKVSYIYDPNVWLINWKEISDFFEEKELIRW